MGAETGDFREMHRLLFLDLSGSKKTRTPPYLKSQIRWKPNTDF